VKLSECFTPDGGFTEAYIKVCVAARADDESFEDYPPIPGVDHLGFLDVPVPVPAAWIQRTHVGPIGRRRYRRLPRGRAPSRRRHARRPSPRKVRPADHDQTTTILILM
jgi:hypothetical protein